MLAAALARQQDSEAEAVLAEARQAADGSEDDGGRVEALGRLALGLAREGAFAEARAIAEAAIRVSASRSRTPNTARI